MYIYIYIYIYILDEYFVLNMYIYELNGTNKAKGLFEKQTGKKHR